MTKKVPARASVAPTAERLVTVAEDLFAEKGFYGTSIRDIAQCLSIAKSSLLHHYPAKEKLYAAVLKKIADEMREEVKTIRESTDDEAEQLRRFIRLLWENSIKKPNRDTIIIREMLDNPKRAGKVRQWFFVDYLNEIAGIIRSGQEKGIFRPIVPELFIFQLLGAHRYLVISLPTIRHFYPGETYRQIMAEHTRELEKFVAERLINKK